MEGITTYIYRNAYNHYFGGIDKYFTPFIASKKMNRRELNEILPEHNETITVVPQILTNRAEKSCTGCTAEKEERRRAVYQGKSQSLSR